MASLLSPTVLLFDVDGTLVRAGGAGRRAVDRALAAHGAEGSARFSFAGMTDWAIVRRSLESIGQRVDDTIILRVLDTYLEFLADEVSRAPGEDYTVCEGVVPALDAAARWADCAVGLGTGNLQRGAALKLGRVGLADRFAFGGYGSDAERREELLRIGAERGATALGCSRSECRVVVIGDTPKDIAAAHLIGAECIAVATGPVPLAELAAHRPDHAFTSLAVPGALEALRGG